MKVKKREKLIYYDNKCIKEGTFDQVSSSCVHHFGIVFEQEMEQLAADQGEEAKMMPNSMIKPLHKIIAEHKDVTKIVIQLNSIITQNKMEAQDVLDIFTKDSHLWDKVDNTSHSD